MPYPRTILTMAKNLIAVVGSDQSVHDNTFNMLWNAILNYHFTLDKDYGVEPDTSFTTGTKPEFLVFKMAHEKERVVLGAELRSPLEESEEGKAEVVEELVAFIQKQFNNQTEFASIYGLGGIGLSWTVFRMDRAGSPEPQTLVPWQSNVTSTWAFAAFKEIASDIHKMTQHGMAAASVR